MKKILILLLLLVNLQLITENGVLRISTGKISAQSMIYEELDGVDVIGQAYTICELCKGQVLRTQMSIHQEFFCPAKTIICSNCHVSYKEYEGHFCNGVCVRCGKSKEQCTCPTDIVNNNSNSGSGGSGGGGSGSSGGGSSGGGSGVGSPNGTGKTMSLLELEFKDGVTLVPTLITLTNLHPQTRNAECVVRALAFMSELQGNDYTTAYSVLTKFAEDGGYNLDDPGRGGIVLRDAIKIFDSFCDVGHDNFDTNNIEKLIGNGYAVGLVTVDNPPHMVTVIGYDKDYYYTAAGDSNGKVTTYQKYSLMGTGYVYFKSIRAPYK